MKIKWIISVSIVVILLICGCKATDKHLPQNSLEIPEPEAGKAVISGVLIDQLTGKPVNGSLFLAHNLSAQDNDIPPTISFSLQYDPSAVVDPETGSFYFENIEPGDNYVLIVHYGPNHIWVVRDNNSENPLRIIVEADQSLELGVIMAQEQK